MEIAILFLVIAILFVIKTVKVVPQQHAWVVERLGKYHASLTPGLNFVVPFVDNVIQKHSLKEIPLDVPSQICITRDNTQLQVDGILYFQVTDPKLASYGSSYYIVAVTQLAQTSLRSVIGKLELDKTSSDNPKHIEVLLPYDAADESGSTADATFAQDVFKGIWSVLGPYFKEGKAVSPSGTLTSSSTESDWASVAFDVWAPVEGVKCGRGCGRVRSRTRCGSSTRTPCRSWASVTERIYSA